MPNWCSYSITLRGDEETIKKLDAIFTMAEPEEDWDSDGIHDFTLIHPIPEDLKITSGYMSEDSPEYANWKAKQEENVAKYGHADWYWWCVHNWGTKWPPSISNYACEPMDDGRWMIYASGQSAWGPPSELFCKVTELYPVDAVITYDEEGMAFGGAEAYKGGHGIYNGYFDFSSIPAIIRVQKKMEKLSPTSDKWDDLYTEHNEAVYGEIDERERLAYELLKEDN